MMSLQEFKNRRRLHMGNAAEDYGRMSRHDDKKNVKHTHQRWPLLEAGFAPATIAKYKPAVHRFINYT